MMAFYSKLRRKIAGLKKERNHGVVPKFHIKKYLSKDPMILKAGAHIGTDTMEMAEI